MRQLATRSLALAATKPKRDAALVGVNAYDESGFEPLKFAERDMTQLKGVLDAAGHPAADAGLRPDRAGRRVGEGGPK